MDNQNSQLLSIINDLSSDESRDVSFLCKDFVPKGASELKDLFMVLKKQGYTDQEITDFVAELLYYLKRFDLLKKHFKCSKDEMEKKLSVPKVAKITPFRLLLFELGELVPDSELMKIKRVFSDEISNAKLDKATDMMDVFTELEKKSLLHNLEYLKNKSEHFVKDFKTKLLEYEQNNPGM
ncbi:caspase-8-like [Rana temporaria]|uniref:caspase-8-like n=1 Tax=Rana temporaria TaxID=8407 RepID=UPI001AAD4DFD|nr:caspase-8-like [Rana temporaria]XP_040213150.1 caspase-8-like [Rana temporaria]